MKTMTITAAYNFLDEWNRLIGFSTPAHHQQIMHFLVDVLNDEPRRGLLNAFRHSGKSTVVGVFAACVLYHNPNARILILSAESNLASRMVSHVKNILENHPWCGDILPDVKREWGSHKITIKRPVGIREPSVICQGITGNITCDDVEVPNTCNTYQKRMNLRERLRELDFILSPNGAMIYIGTPHTKDTIYKTE